MNHRRIRLTIETSESPAEDVCMTSIIQEEDHDQYLCWERVFARAIIRLQAPCNTTPWHFLSQILVDLVGLHVPYSQNSKKLARADENLLEAALAHLDAWNESRRSPRAAAS